MRVVTGKEEHCPSRVRRLAGMRGEQNDWRKLGSVLVGRVGVEPTAR